MRYKIPLILFFLLFLSGSTFAQGDYQKHTVLKGETVSSISRKYGVSVGELLKLNPSTENILYEDQEILIPKSQDSSSATYAGSSSNQAGNSDVYYHTVQSGETKFGLSRRYSVSIEKLENENPHIVLVLQAGHKLKITGGKDLSAQFFQAVNATSKVNYSKTISYVVLPKETLWGLSQRFGLTVDELVSANQDALTGVLRGGQTISIPIKDENGTSAPTQTGESYVVQPGDTKFSLSKRFGISISEMEQLNPQIAAMLQTGHVLVLPSNKIGLVQKTSQVSKPIEPEVTTPQNTTVVSNPTTEVEKYKSYEVQPKQTLFGLAKMAGLSQNQLLELNPDLADGVKIGMIIRVPENALVPDQVPVTTTASVVQRKLFNSLNKVEKKRIAFLYPVNESDFTSWVSAPKVLATSAKPELKRSTDFYLGAQMAMDSLRKLGLQIEDIKVASSVNSILSVAKQKELDKQSLVFYPSNDATAEKVAEYLNKSNVPLLSFFDDTSGTRENNAYVMLPGELQLKILMFEYMKNQGGRIIAIVDPSRKESLAFIKANYPNVVFAQMDKKGIVDVNSIKNALDKSQKNFVVLDSDKVGLILDVTTFLMRESTNYNLQLALVEPKEAIENENLSEMRFVVLKMLYPSAALNDNNALANRFKTNFNRKYNSVPTTEAIQGFDCTFDALLRLYQTQSFETIAKDEETKQLLYRFKYTKSQAGAYNNIGGYILQFDTNTDSKIVN
jgi:LysM repeat protein